MSGNAAQPRPNVLWISTHDINPHLGCYSGVYPGAEQAHTPNLDRLAAEGARFDKAFATAPVCAPSRSSVMTGCHATSIGTMHHRTKATPPADVRLVPEIFREAGYFTTNNWFTDFQMSIPPTTFDEIGKEAHWRHRPSETTPFFAAFHGILTHESMIYVDDAVFAQATAKVPDSARQDPAQVTLPPYHPDTEVFRRAWARYLELITAMDVWVGEILQELDADGLAENTIVVFWSDHGLGMPGGKRWAAEAGVHEPLIMRAPGRVAPGTAVDHLVSFVDLAPTMLSLCGIEAPASMQGHVVLDAMSGPQDVNEYVFSGRDRMDEQEDCSRSVRDQRFRLTRHEHPDRSPMQHCEYPDHLATWAEFRRLLADEADQLSRGELRSNLESAARKLVSASKPVRELYDIETDPHELHNLIDDPNYQDVARRLENALDAWQSEYGDLGLQPEDDLLSSWQPDGRRPTVATPRVEQKPTGHATVRCDTPGARVGWTTDPPSADALTPDPFSQMLGIEPSEGRTWRPVTEALPLNQGLFLKAWRPGYEPSAEVAIEGSR